MTSVAGIILRPPVSQTAQSLLSARRELLELPPGTALDRLPARLRETILAVLEARGDDIGYRALVLTPGRFPGSLAPMGKLKGDDKRIREKREFYEWILKKFHDFLRALFATALHVAIAEVAAKKALVKHDQLLDRLADAANRAKDPAAKKVTQEKIRVVAQQKEDLQEFVDRDIPDFKRTLESSALPAPQQLQQIDKRIMAVRKANRIFDNAYKAVAKVARTSAQFASHAAQMAFRRSSGVRKVVENTVKTTLPAAAISASLYSATHRAPPAYWHFSNAANVATLGHTADLQAASRSTGEGDDDEDGDSVRGLKNIKGIRFTSAPPPTPDIDAA